MGYNSGSYYKKTTSTVNRYIKLNAKLFKPNGKALDIGCGSGANSKFIKDLGMSVTSFDIEDKAKEYCMYNGIQMITSDVMSFQYQPNLYDAVVCIDVLHHLSVYDQHTILPKIANSVNKNGYLFLEIMTNFKEKDGCLSDTDIHNTLTELGFKKYSINQYKADNSYKTFKCFIYKRNNVNDNDDYKSDNDHSKLKISNDTYITSDIHIYRTDKDKLKYDDTYTNSVIKSINDTVGVNDTLLILGDLMFKQDPNLFKNTKTFVNRIKCKNLYLVLGNHDVLSVSDYLEAGFKGVWERIETKDYIFTHFPVSTTPDKINIHGHIHGTREYWNVESNRHIDVHYKTNDFKPHKLSEYIARYNNGFYNGKTVMREQTPQPPRVDNPETLVIESTGVMPTKRISRDVKIFHGSPEIDLKTIKTHNSYSYPHLGPIVFGTPHISMASTFGFKWRDQDFKLGSENGQFSIWLINKHLDFSKKCAIYELYNDGNWYELPNHPNEYVRFSDAKIIDKKVFDSYDECLDAFKIDRYDYITKNPIKILSESNLSPSTESFNSSDFIDKLVVFIEHPMNFAINKEMTLYHISSDKYKKLKPNYMSVGAAKYSIPELALFMWDNLDDAYKYGIYKMILTLETDIGYPQLWFKHLWYPGCDWVWCTEDIVDLIKNKTFYMYSIKCNTRDLKCGHSKNYKEYTLSGDLSKYDYVVNKIKLDDKLINKYVKITTTEDISRKGHDYDYPRDIKHKMLTHRHPITHHLVEGDPRKIDMSKYLMASSNKSRIEFNKDRTTITNGVELRDELKRVFYENTNVGIIEEGMIDETEPVYLVLVEGKTKYISPMIQLVTRSKYSHSGISLSPKLDTIQSYGRENPETDSIWNAHYITESISRYRYLNIAVFAIFVKKKHIRTINDIFNEFSTNDTSYAYNKLLGKAFNIEIKDPNVYKQVCSSFVNYILNQINVDLFDGRRIPSPGELYDKLIYDDRVYKLYEGLGSNYDWRNSVRIIKDIKNKGDVAIMSENMMNDDEDLSIPDFVYNDTPVLELQRDKMYNNSILLEYYQGKHKLLLKAESIIQKMIDMVNNSNDSVHLTDTKLNDELCKCLSDFLQDRYYINQQVIIKWVSSTLGMNASTYISPAFRDERMLIVIHDNLIWDNNKLTSGEILATILHEIGHNMSRTLWIRIVYPVLDIYKSVKLAILLKEQCPGMGDWLGAALVAIHIDNNPIAIMRDTVDKLIKKMVPSYSKLLKFLTRRNDYIDSYIYTIGIYTHLIKILTNISKGKITLPNMLVDTLLYREEQISDSFAYANGYGSELSSGLMKITNTVDANGDEIIHESYYYRICNIYKTISFVAMVQDPHPSVTQRIRTEIMHLENDLKSGNYDNDYKTQLQDDISRCKELLKISESSDEKCNIVSYALANIFKTMVGEGELRSVITKKSLDKLRF